MRRSCAALLLLAFVFTQAGAAFAASDIGVASAVRNEVTATLGSAASRLISGDKVFQNQRIDTQESSSAQLLFLDETALTIGPSSSVILDRFVYDKRTGAGDIVFNSVKGAFRFVSGSAQSSAYKVRTPVASIGVRGTIWSWFLAANGGFIAVCEEGSIEVCDNAGNCLTAEAGEAIYIDPDGNLTGPVPWLGILWTIVDGVSFPLFVRRLDDFSDRPTTVSPSDLNDALDNLEDRTPPPPDIIDVD